MTPRTEWFIHFFCNYCKIRKYSKAKEAEFPHSFLINVTFFFLLSQYANTLGYKGRSISFFFTHKSKKS